jgi:F-type H+-transporting ATPase subunit gamma
MASLKDLKIRINSVKSTQKITSAMKMVAASKLRRAQEAAEAARPYAERMGRMVASMITAPGEMTHAPKLLAGTGSDETHLIVAITSDRGLCGGFNGNIARGVRNRIRALQAENRKVKLFCVGRKGRDQLKREFADLIVGSVEGIGRSVIKFEEARDLAGKLVEMFDAGEFDRCSVFYNGFVSAMTQVVTEKQVIPVPVEEIEENEEAAPDDAASLAVYEFEPSDDAILNTLLPANLSVQVFRALLESNASEQGARMTAMDSATRNAGDMIDDLTMTYNRTRQAQITKELIEIISGAEAL